MRLRLIQLPPLPSYRLAAAVQELVRRQFLLAKESEARRRHAPTGSSSTTDSSSSSSSSTLLSLLVPPPPPTVITFTPQPTYTLGRRQSEDQLSSTERERLMAPLTTVDNATTYTPALVSTLRGGLTTYHGPGQAVLWPILDLKSTLFREPLTVRAYSRLLETTTATVLKRRFGLDAYTTEDPGLWVKSPKRGGAEDKEERKIAALGVHLRRNISALGVAVNLDTPVTWEQSSASADASLSSSSSSSSSPSSADADSVSEGVNPWTRFVPCGLSGKGVACVADEARLRFHGSVPAAWDLRPAPFAAKWASALAVQLGLQDPEVDVADQATVSRMISNAEELLARGQGEDG